MEEIKIHPRKLARQVAKHQLDRSHITGYNKGNISTFSRSWKNIVIEALKPRNKKGVRK